MDSAGTESNDRERLGDYYLYPLAQRTTIANAQQKQVSFLDVKGAAKNPHKIVITLSNVFTTPLATGNPFAPRVGVPSSHSCCGMRILLALGVSNAS